MNIFMGILMSIFERFEPKAFIDNLSYMGKGMLGIFVVIGVIILTVIILNKVTSKKKK